MLLARSAFQKLSAEVTPLVAGLESGEVARVLEDYGWNKSNELAEAFLEIGIAEAGGDGGRDASAKADAAE